MLFPSNHFYNEQTPETFQESDTRDILDKNLYTSYDNSEIYHSVFDYHLFCKANDDKSIMFYIVLYKPASLFDENYHPSRSKFDSEKQHCKPKSSKCQFFNEFLE